MFDGPDYPKALDESLFEEWLESGRESKIGYNYLLVIWDEFEQIYTAVYVEERNNAKAYERYGNAVGQEALVAMYDLYSESRIHIEH